MTKRIKITTQALVSQRRLTVHGYRPTAASRFAVIRHYDDTPWLIVHVRTGVGVNSVLPALSRKLTMTDQLAVCAHWEAMTHLDWSAFDDLPQIGPSSTSMPVIDQVRAGPTVRAMRDAALIALRVAA